MLTARPGSFARWGSHLRWQFGRVALDWHQLIHSWKGDLQPYRKLGLGHAQRLDKLLKQHFTRVRRSAMFWQAMTENACKAQPGVAL